jgi:FtsZ-interacting cell division protein ZipA
MDTWVWIVIAVAAVVLLALAALAFSRRRRSKHLQERFGPEYERTVEERGARREAERELSEREKRHEELDIQPLSEGARRRYAGQWQDVQARFVDDPEGAVREADQLVQQVMAERGYPVDEDFERRAADVSVDYPDVVENFREGHALVERHEAGKGGTEELRQAMTRFRSLFEELLEGEHVEEEVRR